jgi:hypothetical protein
VAKEPRRVGEAEDVEDVAVSQYAENGARAVWSESERVGRRVGVDE